MRGGGGGGGGYLEGLDGSDCLADLIQLREGDPQIVGTTLQHAQPLYSHLQNLETSLIFRFNRCLPLCDIVRFRRWRVSF
jgi:hypothetical protein